jgi:ABC-2 type transport system permease protein
MIHKKYRSLVKISIQNCLAYRSSYFFNILSRFVALLTLFYIWRALFSGREMLNGYTWEQMKTYLFMTFIVNSFISWYSEGRVSYKIHDGSVAMDLLKPLDFQKTQLAGTIGGSAAEIAVSLMFCVLLLPIFGGVSLPPGALNAVCFGISAALSFFIKFGIVYLFGLLCFYTTASMGVRWARGAITDLLSGALVPITFFPASLLALSKALPFQGVVFIPVSIYTGTIGGLSDMVYGLLFQAVWAAALWFMGRAFWRVAVRQVTILGG